jgi:hypothetical protein
MPQLPSDNVIQQYVLYLGGKEILHKQSVLNEIKKYHKELKSKLMQAYPDIT